MRSGQNAVIQMQNPDEPVADAMLSQPATYILYCIQIMLYWKITASRVSVEFVKKEINYIYLL